MKIGQSPENCWMNEKSLRKYSIKHALIAHSWSSTAFIEIGGK